jgi:hypothetical protein
VPVAGIVTIALVVVAIAAIAVFLIHIGSTLRQISSSLETVIGAVAGIPEKTAPIEPVVSSINRDLATARGVLEGLLAKKLGAPSSTPVPPNTPERIHYERAEPAPAAPPERGPEAFGVPAGRIRYRRVGE